jgi:UDP-N-acetylglucosamine transferase subunit ALG13
MIFVTVGNSHHGSLRLLEGIEALAASGLLEGIEALAASGLFAGEVVIAQSGNNPDFHPTNCENRPFLGMDEFNEVIAKARIVICHAGAGTISSVLRSGKTPVVVPRRLKYNEIIDDHQIELLEAFAARELVIPAYEIDDLPAAIHQAAEAAPPSIGFSQGGLGKIKTAIDQLLNTVHQKNE